jgi:putative serine protease PepD
VTGLGGEPRGPHFVSPNLDPWAAPRGAGASAAHASTLRRPRMLLAGLAVLAVSAGSGAVAGGYVAGERAGSGEDPAAPTAPPAQAAPAPVPQAGVPSDLVGAAATALSGVVSVRIGRAGGSGFVVDDQGHIVTNNHVVAGGGGGPVSVVGSDGRRIEAEVIGRDPGSDIAVLRVAPSPAMRPLTLAAAGTTRVGEPVLAVGSPLGLSGTVTAGIVSALDRQVRLGNTGARQSAVQTDASINPGNSGGPLVNARGEVIGVNTAIATLDGSGNIGIGFAIPIDRARQAAQQIISGGG